MRKNLIVIELVKALSEDEEEFSDAIARIIDDESCVLNIYNQVSDSFASVKHLKKYLREIG